MNHDVRKKIERRERKIREEQLRKDPKRQQLIEDGKSFLGNIKFYNPLLEANQI